LIKVAAAVEEALESAPTRDLPLPDALDNHENEPLLERLNARLATIDGFVALANWFREDAPKWLSWWKELADCKCAGHCNGSERLASNPIDKHGHETLTGHVARLSNALAKTDPYRKAAEALRRAWEEGKAASTWEKEIAKRNMICEDLAPLKSLGALCGAVAREAIIGLSERITKLLDRVLLTEQLQFHQAKLDRREGLVVHAGFVPELRIDATLVANTSWIRAFLWCFIFAV